MSCAPIAGERELAARTELEAVFRAALAAVDGAACVRRAVEGRGTTLRIAGALVPPGARLWLVAAGKAAAPMAAAFEAAVGERLAEGIVVTKQGHGARLRRCALHEAGHPVPDARGIRAAEEVRALAERVSPEDVLVVLLSGGASALLTHPLPGLELEDLRTTTAVLLAAGAPIEALNTVRKHLTRLSGGRLALHTRAAAIVLLALSDVPGDRLDLIGSGPCTTDPSRFGDAWAVLQERGVAAAVPAAVREHLQAGMRGALAETPKPGDPRFDRVRAHLLASGRGALRAAAREAARRGLRPVLVTEELSGEARRAGRRLVGLARAAGAPVLLLAGGETTVTVTGDGRGGRCQELALAAALELEGSPGAVLLAAGTDGTDGPTDAAGGWADAATAARGRARGRDPAMALARNDAYGFLEAAGDLLRTGPTGTNVRDLVLVQVLNDPVPGSSKAV